MSLINFTPIAFLLNLAIIRLRLTSSCSCKHHCDAKIKGYQLNKSALNLSCHSQSRRLICVYLGINSASTLSLRAISRWRSNLAPIFQINKTLRSLSAWRLELSIPNCQCESSIDDAAIHHFFKNPQFQLLSTSALTLLKLTIKNPCSLRLHPWQKINSLCHCESSIDDVAIHHFFKIPQFQLLSTSALAHLKQTIKNLCSIRVYLWQKIKPLCHCESSIDDVAIHHFSNFN